MSAVHKQTHLVEQRVEIDRGEIGTFSVESIGRVVTRLSDPSIVQKVLVELGLFDRAIIVAIDVFVD